MQIQFLLYEELIISKIYKTQIVVEITGCLHLPEVCAFCFGLIWRAGLYIKLEHIPSSAIVYYYNFNLICNFRT